MVGIEPYSPIKPTKVGFIFLGPYSLSRAEVFESRALIKHEWDIPTFFELNLIIFNHGFSVFDRNVCVADRKWMKLWEFNTF